jgi:hypothetical protein
MITPGWPIAPGMPLPGLDFIRDRVAAAAREAEQQSVEKSIAVKALDGSSNHGYYFHATDRAPKPGEFKYMDQGVVQVGGVNLAFTILTNDGQERTIGAALEMLRSAQHNLGGAI